MNPRTIKPTTAVLTTSSRLISRRSINRSFASSKYSSTAGSIRTNRSTIARRFPPAQSTTASLRHLSTTPVCRIQATSSKMGVHDIASKAEFEAAINDQINPQGESHKGQIIFLDAFATWCGPCKMIAPTIANWSAGKSDDGKEAFTDYADKVAFYKFDVDNVNDLAQELGVRAMPTFYLFKPGDTEPVETVVGADPRAIKAAINKVLAS